jgi:hypothetical protein
LINTLYQFNDPLLHRAEIPAANGIANVWSVARFYSSLIGHLENGKYKRILNEDILKLATKSNTPKNEIDVVLQTPTSFSMGFMLFDDIFSEFGPGTFGHMGNSNINI